MHLNGNAGATQIISYVVSGVGFLGAGVIMKEGSNVWGLNTAATLWCSAAVGGCAGADGVRSHALTGFVLAGNTLLRPLVNAINRAPIDQAATEAIYEVRLTTTADRIDDSRELLRRNWRRPIIRCKTSRSSNANKAGSNWSRPDRALRPIRRNSMRSSHGWTESHWSKCRLESANDGLVNFAASLFLR